MEEARVLTDEKEIVAAYKQLGSGIPKTFLAFYHGGLNAIITDPRLMCIHYFDRQVVRGYGVFDTINMFNNRLYLFEEHMSRWARSMKLARLCPPKTNDEIRRILFKMAEVVGASTLNFRYWCSRGGKDVDITTDDQEPTIFYCMAMKGRPVVIPKGMMNAYTVSTEVKGPLLAEMKSTNYLLNALAAEEAARKGGLAIMVTEDGYVTEGSVQAVAFVLRDGTFYSPPYYRALRSITQDKVLQLVEQHLIPSGVVKQISRVRMKLVELKSQAVEMMLLGGERIIPIKFWDTLLVSSAKGPVTERLMALLEADYSNPLATVGPSETKL